MNAGSALLGALLGSLWQVTVLAAAFALFRLATKDPHARYAAALGVLGAQLAWPAWTCAQLLQVRLSLASPATLETSGQWQWVPVLWVAGAVAMLARTAGGLLVVRRWVSASEAPERGVLERLEALRVRLGVRPVRWVASVRLSVPFTVGFLKPVVLLPVALLTAVPERDLELLAAHELVHVRRWDYLVNLAQSVVEAFLFFHPAMWWVSSCAREEREYCCDDAVVAQLGAARTYAHALLSLEQSLSPVAVAVPSTGGQFMKRIRRILGVRSASSSVPFAVPLLGLAGLMVLLGSCAAQNLRAVPAVVVPAPELVPALKTFCADVRADATRPELAKVEQLDLLTAVLGNLTEANPKLGDFVAEVSKVPPPQRLDLFKRSIGSAVGTDWQCADFDALWAGTFTR